MGAEQQLEEPTEEETNEENRFISGVNPPDIGSLYLRCPQASAREPAEG